MSTAKSATNKKSKPADTFSPVAFKNNVGVISYFRTFVSVISGITVGILGISGWQGFLFHFATQLLCAPAMVFKGCAIPKEYFGSITNLLFVSVFSSTTLLSFLLFWMIFYNLCHVF